MLADFAEEDRIGLETSVEWRHLRCLDVAQIKSTFKEN
jgi:hypothetical protein